MPTPSPVSRSPGHAQYRPDIDGLRAVAVLPVVFYHSGLNIAPGGYIGVDVFFVISGFLITRILANEITQGRFSVLRFYERRARRILPALSVVLAASFIAGWFLLLPKDFSTLAKSAGATIVFLSNFWFLRQSTDYFGGGAEMNPLLHTWSLAVEEQFYIVFPLLLLLLLPRGRRMTVALVAVLALLSLGWAMRVVPNQPSTAFFSTQMRVWELGVGALLALGLVPPLRMRWLRETVAALALAAILLPVLLYDALTLFPGLTAVPPVLGAAALIAAGGQGDSLTRRILSWRPMVAVGLISYSLYLWHWPVFVFAKHYLGVPHLPLGPALIATTAGFVLGWASWRFVERPFRKPPPAGFSRTQIFAGSIVTMAVLGAASVAVFLGQGVPSRLSTPVLLAVAAAEDRNPDRNRCAMRPGGQRFCAFQPGTDRIDVLLWGDSHAMALMPAVKHAATASGRSGAYTGTDGCVPFAGIDLVHRTRSNDCSHFNQQVLTRIEQRDDMQTVVFSARWPLYSEGFRPASEGGKPWLLAPADALDAPADPARNWDLFEAAARQTVARVRATGRSVILIGPVPEIGWDVPTRYALNLMWGHALPPVPDAEALARRQGRVTALFESLAADDPGVRYVPIAQALCAPDCRTDLDGQLIYFDDDHLNRFGAETVLAPILLDMF